MSRSNATTPAKGISVELFTKRMEEISEVACTDLALGLDALKLLVTIAEDDFQCTQPFHRFYPVLSLVNRQLQESKDTLERLVTETWQEVRHAAP